MKNSNIFLILILSLASMFIILSCDQASDQHNSNLKPNDDVALSTRGDCDLCPGDDECCCSVWLQPTGGTITLEFCGTSSGIACIGGSSGNCPSISGGGITRLLMPSDPRKFFCMDEEAPFVIYNPSSTDTAKIIISCQIDRTPPDTMWLIILPLGLKYIQTNSNCEVDPC